MIQTLEKQDNCHSFIADVMHLGGHAWEKTKGTYSAQCKNCGMKRIDHTPINGALIAPSYSTPEKIISTVHEPPCA